MTSDRFTVRWIFLPSAGSDLNAPREAAAKRKAAAEKRAKGKQKSGHKRTRAVRAARRSQSRFPDQRRQDPRESRLDLDDRVTQSRIFAV
jgi:hypothetical protein